MLKHDVELTNEKTSHLDWDEIKIKKNKITVKEEIYKYVLEIEQTKKTLEQKIYIYAKSKKKKLLETYLKLRSSLIIFESGKKLQKTLELIVETCKPSTEICICRELTKFNEEVTRFEAEEGIKETIDWYRNEKI